jgi:hypothetical protein
MRRGCVNSLGIAAQAMGDKGQRTFADPVRRKEIKRSIRAFKYREFFVYPFAKKIRRIPQCVNRYIVEFFMKPIWSEYSGRAVACGPGCFDMPC